jgi:hypothetical protein
MIPRRPSASPSKGAQKWGPFDYEIVGLINMPLACSHWENKKKVHGLARILRFNPGNL